MVKIKSTYKLMAFWGCQVLKHPLIYFHILYVSVNLKKTSLSGFAFTDPIPDSCVTLLTVKLFTHLKTPWVI